MRRRPCQASPVSARAGCCCFALFECRAPASGSTGPPACGAEATGELGADGARSGAEKDFRPSSFGLVMIGAIADELLYNEQRNEVVFVNYSTSLLVDRARRRRYLFFATRSFAARFFSRLITRLNSANSFFLVLGGQLASQAAGHRDCVTADLHAQS